MNMIWSLYIYVVHEIWHMGSTNHICTQVQMLLLPLTSGSPPLRRLPLQRHRPSCKLPLPGRLALLTPCLPRAEQQRAGGRHGSTVTGRVHAVRGWTVLR